MANNQTLLSLVLAIGAPAPAMLTTFGDTMSAIVNATPADTSATPAPAPIVAPAPAVLTMSAIRKALPEYFGRDAISDAQALIDRNQKYAPLCATLAGYAIERAQSGNANGLAKFDAWSQGLKHAQGAKVRALCAHVNGVKPAHLKSADVSAYSDFAESIEMELLALVAPAPAKAKGPSVSYKALYETLQAEHAALQAEHAALKAKVSAKGATPAPADASATPADNLVFPALAPF